MGKILLDERLEHRLVFPELRKELVHLRHSADTGNFPFARLRISLEQTRRQKTISSPDQEDTGALEGSRSLTSLQVPLTTALYDCYNRSLRGLKP
jgi:hypothetical protein